MLRSHRLPLTLLTAGLLTPAVAHAEAPSTAAPPPAAAPAPEAAAPAPAPAAPAPAAPAPAETTPPTATTEAAAPAPAETTPPTATTEAAAPAAPTASAEATPPTAATEAATGAIAAPEISSPADPPGASTTDASPSAVVDAPPAAEPPADPYVHVPFDIGLFPPLSINGTHRNQKIRNTISVAFGWTRTDRLEGAAAALGMTIVDEDARGVTWGLLGNITRGEHQGIQATHGYNHAGSLRGVQLGAINHAHEARGVQAGLINVGRGRVRGVQLGLINYAEEADASFALIPVTKKGGVRPEVWTSDTAAINVGLRLPANYTYAFFAGGLHPIARREPPVALQDGAQPERERTDGMALMAGMGFGGHLPVTNEVGLDGDVSGWVVTSGLRAGPPLASLAKLRAMVAWQLRPRLAVWGGPTLNVMVDRVDDGVPRPGYGWVANSGHEVDGVRIRWWPGFAAGLRF